jgi:hypothetical protein
MGFVLTSVFLGQHRAFLLEHYPVYVNLLILVLPEKTLVRVLVIIGIALKRLKFNFSTAVTSVGIAVNQPHEF